MNPPPFAPGNRPPASDTRTARQVVLGCAVAALGAAWLVSCAGWVAAAGGSEAAGPAPRATVTATATATATATRTREVEVTVTETRTVTERAEAQPAPEAEPEPDPAPAEEPAAPAYFANCDAARAAGAAPVRAGDPGYGPHLDRDGDGVVCE
ncbi:excalibur calcium-binding domain-containing protein [Allonocardiopsis opalescens]|uniref:Excalibur calcium-binding domain-containing protein n=1 Tax=Allonocardiopsis opalescens TaxID=1144618 RepID=A0A2T0PTV9_9ACTN|nr:excalibur calcium-binding domain-containing protein [Allonocardiopsis opalescens]PRX92337.1 excalibur calcium-binding domain-containing protein [Allonocardiopsis opalescens]